MNKSNHIDNPLAGLGESPLGGLGGGGDSSDSDTAPDFDNMTQNRKSMGRVGQLRRKSRQINVKPQIELAESESDEEPNFDNIMTHRASVGRPQSNRRTPGGRMSRPLMKEEPVKEEEDEDETPNFD